MAWHTLSARVSTICSAFVARITGWFVPVGCASPVAWAQFSASWSHHYTGARLSPQFDRLDAGTSDSIAGRK
jgi:hypothetical protein